MRYLTLAAAVVSVGAASAQAQPLLTFTSDSDVTMLNAGDTFEVDVDLAFDPSQVRGESVATAQFDLSVNGPSSSSVLTLTGLAPNGGLESFVTVIAGQLPIDLGVNNEGSGFDLGAGTFGPGFNTGPLSIGTYTFEVAADAVAGDYELAITDNATGIAPALFTTANFADAIAFDSGVLGFTVVVPEPATAVLFAMPALAMLRRRRGA